MKAIEEVLHGWADYEKIRQFLKKKRESFRFPVALTQEKHISYTELAMVLERKSLLLLANKKPENCMRTVVFLMAIPCTIRRKIFYFTSQTYGEIS